jgi:hypothetical protein
MSKKCILCGKKRSLQTVSFPHGEITFCTSCRKELTYRINGSTDYPVVWVGLEDYLNHFEGDKEKCSLIKTLWEKEGEYLANRVSDYIWDGSNFGDTFHDALDESLELLRRSLEKEKIEKSNPEELPLLIGKILFDENKVALEKRLKGEKTYGNLDD